LTPFPYQVEALDAMRAHLSQGKRAPLLVSPTGAGKTFMGCMAAKAHLDKNPSNRVVWLAHRRELVEQAYKTAGALGCRNGFSAHMVQTMLARGEAPEATLAVFDEAHHFAAEEWSRLGQAYQGVPRLGLTATPERGDGLGLGDMFDCIVSAASVSELIELGRLVPVTIHRPRRALGSKQISQHPADAYETIAPHGRAIVFCPNIRSCEEFAAEFEDRAIPTDVVTGAMKQQDREEALARFESGQTRVLLNVNVLTEGWDCPPADTCIIARTVGTPGLAIQMWGRVMRCAPGKTRAHLIDLTGVTWVHGGPGQDREYALEGDGIRLVGTSEQVPTYCKVCGSQKEPGVPCETCGSNTEMVVPKTTNDELEKVDWREILKKDEPNKVVARLIKWVAESRAKGHRPQSALFKFKSAYGRWPHAHERKSAGL
jgi:DNA repair protein RadD